MADHRLGIIAKKGAIHSVDDWFNLAPPKGGESHWRDGKSAKELAKAWFRSGAPVEPAELRALLESHPATASAHVTRAKPEHETRFDDLPGGGRNHDLLLKLGGGTDLIIAGVEGKAGESLDTTVIAKYDKGIAIRDSGKNTNLPDRVESLVRNLFGRALSDDVDLGRLRYQLLTATAGTLIEAKNANAVAALVIVHELIPRRDDRDITPTQRAISDFVDAFRQVDVEKFIAPGTLYGPITVAGGGRLTSDVPLYVALIEPEQDRQV